MAHAKCSPSSAYRWLRCAQSVQLAAFYPEKETAASREGTRQHAIAEKHLLAGTDSTDNRMQIYLDEVRSYEGEMLVEKKVVIHEELCWGTSDAIIIQDNTITTIDLKWGVSPVSADNNPQLKLYSLGALDLYGKPLLLDTEINQVIVQPNATKGNFIKRSYITVGELLEFKESVLRAIDRVISPSPTCAAGRWCHFCKAKLHCKEYLIYAGMKSGA